MRNRLATLHGRGDRAETVLQAVDERMSRGSGVSIFHLFTLASIVGSLVLFMRGRKMEGIFVGLWPPTFEALRSASKRR